MTTDRPAQSAFDSLCQHFREIALLASTQELLEWDERTMMPPEAGAYRAEQTTFLAGLIHQRRVDPRVGEWLAALADDPAAADRHSDRGATLYHLRRDYEKRQKVPQRLVEELTRASMLGQQAWVEARKNSDFKSFLPHVEKIVRLKREQAEAVGYAAHPYDALLDDYEPGAKTSEVAQVLAALRRELAPLVAAIVESGVKAPVEILQRHYPTDAQRKFGEKAAAAIGFNFRRGRLDVTHHPFCTGLGPSDTRITTRYDEKFFPSAFFGILHEAGHGIYDQCLPNEHFGLPPGEYVSLGIHESQSRMWENLVGRSRAFWRHFLPQAQAAFPEALSNVRLDDFHFAINDVRPSLIRVEADEATYNLHIIARFELEQALISDELRPADLPAAWNEKYRTLLGIEPESDANGVLQDIHWSAALIGYFPTYSLGNLYAAQLFDQADRDLGGVEEQFARGEFEPLRQWLTDKIHRHGKRYTASELVVRATGKPLSHAPLIRYLKGKLGRLYQLAS